MARPGKVLTNQILAEHGARPDLRLWNNPTAYAHVGTVVGRKGGNVVLRRAHPVRMGLVVKGASDLIGITNTGRFISIEVKAGKDTLKPHQRKWLDLIKKMGGIAGVARSVQDVTDLLGEPPTRRAT